MSPLLGMVRGQLGLTVNCSYEEIPLSAGRAATDRRRAGTGNPQRAGRSSSRLESRRHSWITNLRLCSEAIMIPSGKMGGTIACLGLQLMLVSNASAQGQQPPSPGQMGQDGAYTVGSGVTTPTVLTHAAPHVPELALKLHAAGDVLLSLVVKADRSIRDVQVVRSVGYGMDEEAIETVKKWRFSAGTKDGIPVDIRIRVEVGFREAPNSRVWGAGPIVFGLPTGSTAPRLKSGLMPKSASQAGDEIVVLQFTLNSVGETGDIRALQGLDSPSLRMLIKSLSAWTFEPSPGIVAPVVGKVLLIKGEDQFRYTVAEAFRNLGSVPPAEPVTAAAPSPGQVPASSSKTDHGASEIRARQ